MTSLVAFLIGALLGLVVGVIGTVITLLGSILANLPEAHPVSQSTSDLSVLEGSLAHPVSHRPTPELSMLATSSLLAPGRMIHEPIPSSIPPLLGDPICGFCKKVRETIARRLLR